MTSMHKVYNLDLDGMSLASFLQAMIREEVNDMEDYNQRLAEAAAKRKQRPTGKQAHAPPQPPLTVQPAPSKDLEGSDCRGPCHSRVLFKNVCMR